MAKRVLNSVLNNQTNTLYWAGVDGQGRGAQGYQYYNYPIDPYYLEGDISKFSADRYGSNFIIKTNGTLWAWGQNYLFGGQLGLNTIESFNSPTQIGSDTNWSQIWACYQYTLALKTDGTLWSWGSGSNGALGLGNSISRSSPNQIGTDTNWSKLGRGGYNTGCSIALKTNNTLWSWGGNSSGQLGHNDTANRSSPTQIGNDAWSDVSCSAHVIAVKNDGTLWGWGLNDLGQLGLNDIANRSSPTQISSDTDWSYVTTNLRSTVALKTDGTLWLCGNGIYGRLGLGNTISRSVLTQVGTQSYNSVWTGYYHTIAIRSNGTLWGWGYNVYGQQAQGAVDIRASQNSPRQIGTDTDWEDVCCGEESSFFLKNGNLYTGGWCLTLAYYKGLMEDDYVIDPAPTYLQNVKTLDTLNGVGNVHYGVIKNDGTLWTWGYNNYGNLGLGNYNSVYSAIQVGADTDWDKIFIASDRTHLLKTNGTLWCCGYNNYGELGLGDNTSKNSPIQLGTDTWISFGVGRFNSIGIKSDGTLWTWGRNNVGQLGQNDLIDRSSPTQVGTDNNWLKIGNSQYENMIALKTDGTLWSWGYNNYYNLGLGDQIARSSPVQIGTDTDWAYVFGGIWGGAAIKNNGTLWFWGWNSFSQYGSSGSKSIPTQYGTDTDWSFVSMGYDHTIALKTNGIAWGAGYNGQNQLALGITPAIQSTFVQIGARKWSEVYAYDSFTYFKL